MKRITAVLMTLILLLCFTACGNQSAEKMQLQQYRPLKILPHPKILIQRKVKIQI